MVTLVGLSGFALAGSRSTPLACAIFAAAWSPSIVSSEAYGAWQFGKIDGICAVASQSIETDDARSFNIMVTNDDRILFYISLGEGLPSGVRHFGVRMNEQIYWQVGVVENGALLFDLSNHPESSDILAEIIDGSVLTLVGGLGENVAQFSLRGSGRAVARLSRCVEDGS